MQPYYPIISAVLCLFCFLCCKGWATALDIGAANDKHMRRLARTLHIVGDVFNWSGWAFVVAGILRALGLF